MKKKFVVIYKNLKTEEESYQFLHARSIEEGYELAYDVAVILGFKEDEYELELFINCENLEDSEEEEYEEA